MSIPGKSTVYGSTFKKIPLKFNILADDLDLDLIIHSFYTAYYYLCWYFL